MELDILVQQVVVLLVQVVQVVELLQENQLILKVLVLRIKVLMEQMVLQEMMMQVVVEVELDKLDKILVVRKEMVEMV